MNRRVFNHQAIGGQFQHGLHLHFAGTTTGAGAGGIADGFEAAVAVVYCGHNLGLGNAVAVANLGVVGQVFHIQHRHGIGGQREQQLGAVLRKRLSPVERLQNPRHRQAVAQQDRAGNLAIAHDDLLVDVPVGFHVGNHFVFIAAGVFVAGHSQFHAHYLQLGGYA